MSPAPRQAVARFLVVLALTGLHGSLCGPPARITRAGREAGMQAGAEDCLSKTRDMARFAARDLTKSYEERV